MNLIQREEQRLQKTKDKLGILSDREILEETTIISNKLENAYNRLKK